MKMNSIAEAVKYYATERPNRLCVADTAYQYTYAQFFDYAKMLASQLKEYAGKVIVMRCSQDGTYLAMKTACELIGAIFVPVERDASETRIKEIISETDAALFMSDKQIEGLECDCCGNILYDGKIYEDDFSLPKAEDTVEVLFTTGTTGKSKGVEVSSANNIALAENIIYGVEMRKDNVELIPLPISHSHGLRSCYANLVNGCSIVLSNGVMMTKVIFDMIEKYNVISMDFSPSAIKTMMKLGKDRFFALAERLDYIEIGTAVLDEETKATLIERFKNTRLYNFYGSTESGRSCILDFRKENKNKCVGKPTKNAKFIVTDENRKKIVSSKENMGLLACAGAMNMKGYWRQPELTKETMRDGYIFTNDLSYIDEEGYVYVFGRKDSIINYGGIKIAPDEIEEKILKYKDIEDCCCVPKNDPIYGQVPYLYIVVRKGSELNRDDFMTYMRKHIDNNKLPKQIEQIDSIPRTFNGKLQRNKLIERCNG